MSGLRFASRSSPAPCGHWACHFANRSRGNGRLFLRGLYPTDSIPIDNNILVNIDSPQSACLLDCQILTVVGSWAYAKVKLRTLAVDTNGIPKSIHGQPITTTFEVAGHGIFGLYEYEYVERTIPKRIGELDNIMCPIVIKAILEQMDSHDLMEYNAFVAREELLSLM